MYELYMGIVLCGSFFEVLQGVIATPSMSKHVDGFGRITFHMQVCSAHILLLLLCIMCTLVCSLVPRSPLQPSKRRVCFEANLYHALMTRPCLIFCYAYLYTPHIHQKVRIGRCVCVGGALSLVKLSDQFILSMLKAGQPVYSLSRISCLQSM